MRVQGGPLPRAWAGGSDADEDDRDATLQHHTLTMALIKRQKQIDSSLTWSLMEIDSPNSLAMAEQDEFLRQELNQVQGQAEQFHSAHFLLYLFHTLHPILTSHWTFIMSKIKAEDETEVKRRKLHAPSHHTDVNPEMPSQPSLEPSVYEPLDHNTDSTRVIQLYPDPDDDAVIRCTMRNARLTSTRYTCLSYTWQPSHPQHTIDVNGRGLSVGENLYRFLRAYRKHQRLTPVNSTHTGTHELWIDAVCIQQSHAAEKNHQVGQMGEVCKNADRVLVWLGRFDQETQDFLAEFSTLFEQAVCIARREPSSRRIETKQEASEIFSVSFQTRPYVVACKYSTQTFARTATWLGC